MSILSASNTEMRLVNQRRSRFLVSQKAADSLIIRVDAEISWLIYLGIEIIKKYLVHFHSSGRESGKESGREQIVIQKDIRRLPCHPQQMKLLRRVGYRKIHTKCRSNFQSRRTYASRLCDTSRIAINQHLSRTHTRRHVRRN